MVKTRKRPMGKIESGILERMRALPPGAIRGSEDHSTNKAVRSLEARGLVEVLTCEIEHGYVGHRLTQRNWKSYVVLTFRLKGE